MTPCAHTWIPLSASLDECALCGAQQAPRWCRCINSGQFTRQEVGPPGTPAGRVMCLRCDLAVWREPAMRTSGYIHLQSGAIVRPPPPSQAERDKRRPLPPEILADALQDGAGPPMGRVISTRTIHGWPVQWPPITETESHD